MKLNGWEAGLVMGILSAFVATAHAQAVSKAPANLQAAVLSKAMAFDKSLSGDLTVFVLADKPLAEEFRKLEGTKVGEATIAKVESGDVLPESIPHVLFVGQDAEVGTAISFTQNNRILSMTGVPEFVEKGVTLGVGVVGGKPKILLNTSASKKEGRKWDPAIINIAKVYN